METRISGDILVASKIVDYLSSGLYSTPAACLKELINNSYDADATVVRVHVKPEANQVIIADNGHGISANEFETHFRRVAESSKRLETSTTVSGRPKIGMIGIGLIAANEICDQMQVRSTRAGSADLLDVTIDFAKMRGDGKARATEAGEYKQGDYHGQVSAIAELDEHYTQLILRKVRAKAAQMLIAPERETGERARNGFYGKSEENIKAVLLNDSLVNWSQLDSYSETITRVALNVPVGYHKDWMPSKEFQSDVSHFTRAAESLDFKVLWDGSSVLKPIVFRKPDRGALLHTFEFQGDLVSGKGYIFVQHGTIMPRDLNGILVRIRNSSVGEYDQTYLRYPQEKQRLFQAWASGEVWASDDLEEALNIDRSSMRVTDPVYVEFRKLLHTEVDTALSRARTELYGSAASERKEEKVKRQQRELADLEDRVRSSTTDEAADEFGKAWDKADSSGGALDSKDLLRTYSVSQLYEIVLQAADESLTKKQSAAFVKALTRRLRGA